MVPGCTVVPCTASADVFEQVAGGTSAVIPIENSLAGPVAEHLDLLLENDVFVWREFRLRIQHNLIAAPGVRLPELRRVFSHPVALAQCRDFFRRHRKIEPVPFYDTAGAVKHGVGNQL
jgi:prephenate dehydratase